MNIYSEKEVADVYAGVQGLIRIFQRKIYYLPSSIATLSYKIIVRHLSNHYKKPATLEECQSIRYMVRITNLSFIHSVLNVSNFSPFIRFVDI